MKVFFRIGVFRRPNWLFHHQFLGDGASRGVDIYEVESGWQGADVEQCAVG